MEYNAGYERDTWRTRKKWEGTFSNSAFTVMRK